MQDALFEDPFANVVIQGALGTLRKSVRAGQWLSMYSMALPMLELGSTEFSASCFSNHSLRSCMRGRCVPGGRRVAGRL